MGLLDKNTKGYCQVAAQTTGSMSCAVSMPSIKHLGRATLVQGRFCSAFHPCGHASHGNEDNDCCFVVVYPLTGCDKLFIFIFVVALILFVVHRFAHSAVLLLLILTL